MFKSLIRKNPDGEQKEKMVSKDYLLAMLSGSGMSFTNIFFGSALVLYVVEILGGTQMQAGLLSTAYTATAILARVLAGTASDRFGRVKLLIGSAFLCALACAVFGLFAAIPALIVIRAIHGFGFGVQHTCSGAIVADVVPKSRLAEGIGIFGLHTTLSHAAGPAIAIAIIAGGTVFHFRALFFMAAGLCAIGMIAGCFITYERKRKAELAKQLISPPEKKRKDLPFLDQPPVGKTFLGFERAVFAPGIVLVVLFIGITSNMVFLMPFATTHIGIENPGLYFTFSAIGVFISRIIFGKIVDKRGADIVIIPGLIVMAACFAMIPFARSLPGLVAIGFPLGLAQGAIIPTFNSLVLMRCSPSKRGAATGAFGVSIDLGFSIGAPVLGALADARGLRYIFWASAILITISFVLFILFASDKRYRAKQKAEKID